MGSLVLKVLTLTVTFGVALRSNALPQTTHSSATMMSFPEQTVKMAEDEQQSQTFTRETRAEKSLPGFRCSCFFDELPPTTESSSNIRESCRDWQKTGANKSGVYSIRLPGDSEIQSVWCDMDSSYGGWLVFQRRRDGSVDFYRNWTQYEHGFGDVTGEFWLGLSRLHSLTKGRPTQLRVDLSEVNGHRHYAEYSSFRVGGPETNYTLTVSGFSGNAGDSLAVQNNHSFLTYDRDNDKNPDNCATLWHGAWWYNFCHSSNLNGRYKADGALGADGVNWLHAHNDWRSFTFSEMKIKPL